MHAEQRRVRDRAGWEQRYVDGDLPWDTGRPDVHLSGVLQRHDIQPSKGLEIGCGTGTNTIWLTQQGFQMTGVDFAESAIAQAEAKVAAAGVDCTLLVRNFLEEDVPGAPYRFVYDRGAFHTIDAADQRFRFAAHVAELLAPEGIWHSLIGSTDGPPRDSGPPRRSATEIAAAVEPLFEILELNSTEFDHAAHNDKRAWILVARKREL